MKVRLILCLMLAALSCLAFVTGAGEGAAAETAAAEATAAVNSETKDEPAEWTVLFYFCGSDLESRYSYASGNLAEIAAVTYPDFILPFVGTSPEYIEEAYEEGQDQYFPGKVNVLIETGGSEKWHAGSIGLHISTKNLQRWQLHYTSVYDPDCVNTHYIELVETCPLASMGSPQPLTEYIQWGIRNYPAKKYALVLWDHGGGALTGLFVDELFNGDILYLNELDQALANAGATFEAVILDACMMANMETAGILKKYARWMVASEEVVPGKGTALRDWLQELVNNPRCDGRLLGRNICDMTMQKYANAGSNQDRSTLTWSVIDLTKYDDLLASLNRFFQFMGEMIRIAPESAMSYASMILSAEEYGDGQQDMRDMSDVLYNKSSALFMNLEMRNELLNRLSEVIVYSVRGSGRNGARGLSFCYPTDCTHEELDQYALNCPNPYYLAYLDAVTDWTAPDWVYSQTERLPELDTLEAFHPEVTLCWTSDNMPAIQISKYTNISDIYYRLYKLDEATSQIACLGRTDCIYTFENDKSLVVANEPWLWPSIDGIPCTMDMLLHQYRTDTEEERLYNIPIQLGTDNRYMRCDRIDTYDAQKDKTVHRYDIFGIWDGYEENSQMLNRSVTKLSEFAGQEYRLQWALDGTNKYMAAGPSERLYRALDISEAALPAGTYYLEYEIDDMFQRPAVLQRIKMVWDGNTLSFPDRESWNGTIVMSWTSEKAKPEK